MERYSYVAPSTRLASAVLLLLGLAGFAGVLVLIMTVGAEFFLSV